MPPRAFALCASLVATVFVCQPVWAHDFDDAQKEQLSRHGQGNSEQVYNEQDNDERRDEASNSGGVVSERTRVERAQAFNPYLITAHKLNYFQPLSITSDINESVYEVAGTPLRSGLRNVEVNFQISLKSQVNQTDLLFADDALFFGITLESWWQLYNSALSSPFRETNYQPELFYITPLLWGPFGGRTALMFGIEHQSNGQVESLSRSWNRVNAALVYERGSLVATVKPWYRIPEDPKTSLTDARGDDNPDILDFFGHGEFTVGYRRKNIDYYALVRGNPSTRRGALDVVVSFPLFGKFRGMLQYFNGYGDSLIDYDRFQQRLGIGVALSNLF